MQDPTTSADEIDDTPAVRSPSRVARLLLGEQTVRPLTIAHGLASAGDVFVSVSLAGSLFFNVSPDASRQQVLLYLLVTMAPMAVLAPLVGPTVDRFRRFQRYVASLFYVLRGVCCLALVSTLLSVAFYPLALVLLIASKASGVVKQTLVQSLVDEPDELVATNARLARFASIVAALAAAVAAPLLALTEPEWTLRVGAVLFALAGGEILRSRPRPARAAASADIEYAETHLPTVFVGSIGIIAIRAAVGFFIFTLAFTLRRDSQPAWIYGLAAVCYGAGAFVGHSLTSLLRRRFREEQLIGLAIAAPAAFTVVGMLGVSTPLLMVIAAMVGLSTTMGRHAFDSLLQRRAPEALLGRAGARYETRFQLAWVVGGALATPITLAPEVAMSILTAMYVPGLVVFARALRDAHRFEAARPDELAGASQRLVVARQSWEAQSYRAAIVDAAGAIDLARTVCGRLDDHEAQLALEDLRRAAINPAVPVGDPDAVRALRLATALLDSAVVEDWSPIQAVSTHTLRPIE